MMKRSIKKLNIDALIKKIEPLYNNADPAHDFTHVLRVYKNAAYIGEKEGSDMEVLLFSSLLHDVGSELKFSEKSERANSLRTKMVDDFLRDEGISEVLKNKVVYAVDVHRYSKGIVPITLEAKVLQDADRLDAIGAIGIARVFMAGGTMGRKLYNPKDPFCKFREPDDEKWNLDHFYKKLLKLESGMHTDTAKKLAERRCAVLRKYLLGIEDDIDITRGI
jgi:uncharacterized protein